MSTPVNASRGSLTFTRGSAIHHEGVGGDLMFVPHEVQKTLDETHENMVAMRELLEQLVKIQNHQVNLLIDILDKLEPKPRRRAS
jgi:hypothetical protein